MARHTTARISTMGEHFEVLVNPDAALNYKLKKQTEISRVLIVDIIFTDSSKGLRASEEKLKKAFNTVDVLEIAKTILRRGELQLTSEQRDKLVEEKRRKIISLISKNCIDPRTGYPHPPIRIEQAMNQIRLVIDPFKSGEEQAMVVINDLRKILPLRFEKIKLAIKIPPEHVAKSIGIVKEFGDINNEEWQSDGSWIAIVEMPAGLHTLFLEKIGKVAKGNYQTKII